MNLAQRRELLATCVEARRIGEPDEDSEAVAADWAEGAGLEGLAFGLRHENGHVRWSAAATMLRMIDPDWIRHPIARPPQVRAYSVGP